MKKLKSGLLSLLLLIGCVSFSGCSEREPDIVVGAKDFTEQYILGNMLALMIERNTNLTVELSDNLATEVIFASARTGVIDIYVEYTGTVYGSYLELSQSQEPEEVFNVSSGELLERYDIRSRPVLGFNNTFALAVTRETAELHNLQTISDLAAVSQDMIFGGSAEILARNDGLPNLRRTYSMRFASELAIDGVDRYTALINGTIHAAEVFSTDGMLEEHNLVVLEDDRNYFPPYEGFVLIRGEIADEYPQIVPVLDRLIGVLTDDVMRDLNHRVDVRGESPRDVAEAFLRERGLI